MPWRGNDLRSAGDDLKAPPARGAADHRIHGRRRDRTTEEKGHKRGRQRAGERDHEAQTQRARGDRYAFDGLRYREESQIRSNQRRDPELAARAAQIGAQQRAAPPPFILWPVQAHRRPEPDRRSDEEQPKIAVTRHEWRTQPRVPDSGCLRDEVNEYCARYDGCRQTRGSPKARDHRPPGGAFSTRTA